jgi:hypothetical protein
MGRSCYFMIYVITWDAGFASPGLSGRTAAPGFQQPMRHGKQRWADKKPKKAKGNQPAKNAQDNERKWHFAAAFNKKGANDVVTA